jgi:NADH:ubiquinone oxidoreductase subunit 5 (subunit L)/multisubunit Na+/H+ antiporter MnhA subunit
VALLGLIILVPWLGAVILPCLPASLQRHAAVWALVPPAASFLLALSFVPSVSEGQSYVYALPWFPALGVHLSLWVDGVGLLFALLISGIGLLVTWYARYYLAPSEPLPRFFAYLLMFMGAMLGLVLAADLIGLFVFWELTSLSSFLLIGFWQTRQDSLFGARQALLVTSLGGLALLGGAVLLHQVTGTFELPELARMSAVIRESPAYPAIVGLVLIGACAKSAQLPWHFWLPNAMAAPTPVSAYLHSATMVKAGLFLVCRMLPILGGTATWLYAVSGIGLLTMLLGGLLAIRQQDLKALLAYSTVSQLGAIMALYGSTSAGSVYAATFHLFNHAAFKGALFLLVGVIEHETGSRDRRELAGLWTRMPVTGSLMAVAALAMAGVPPLNGFLSKEMIYDTALVMSAVWGSAWLLPVVAVLGSLLTVTYALALFPGLWWGRPKQPVPSTVHDPGFGMLLMPAVLAGVCVVVGVWPQPFDRCLIAPAVASVVGQTPWPPLALWHGLTVPLLMSGVALAGGVALYAFGGAAPRQRRGRPGALSMDAVYVRGLEAIEALGAGLSAALQSGYLKFSLMMTLGFLVLSFGYPFVVKAGARLGPLDLAAVEPYELMLVALLMAGALAVVGARQPLSAVLTLGLVGLLVSFLFVVLRAPDLALTQLLIETASLILFLLVLRFLPPFAPEVLSFWVRFRDAAISVMVGGLVVVLLLIANSETLYPSIAGYFLENSRILGGGRNVVNVIVVDFRGYDTMGEITVLTIAAIGVYTLIKRERGQPQR